MGKNHGYGVLKWVTPRLANAGAEVLNSKIAPIQKRVHGFRIKEHIKTAALLFRCGGRRLCPVSHPTPG